MEEGHVIYNLLASLVVHYAALSLSPRECLPYLLHAVVTAGQNREAEKRTNVSSVAVAEEQKQQQ